MSVSSRVVQVTLLSDYLRDLIESDELLADIWVDGEVSNLTVARSGHAYLSLREDDAVLDCVMWRPQWQRQAFLPRIGDRVVAHGQLTTYERQSRYQLKADVFQPAGVGILQLQLEQLRQQLDAEGLFDPTRKRPLPDFPRRIGVATSSTGAVWQDIQRVIERRYPIVELVLAPTLVQGTGAPSTIVAALERLQQEDGLDLIILARGGGSMEDLWCFNDQRVVRAIFASRVPVVSAVGHETDVTLSDLVADLRAPTPSVAAELVVPDRDELIRQVRELYQFAGHFTVERIGHTLHITNDLVHRLHRLTPAIRLQHARSELDAIATLMALAGTRSLDKARFDLRCTTEVLNALNPEALLRRGYGFVSVTDGQPVRSASELPPDMEFRATFADGAVDAITVRRTQR